MSKVEPNQSLSRSTPEISSKYKKTSTLLKEEAKNIDEVLRIVARLAAIAEKNIPTNIVLFVEPDKRDRLLELVEKALAIPQGSFISKNIAGIKTSTSVESIVCNLKEEINSAHEENILVVIEGFENHLLDTLRVDLSKNRRQPHDFLQGSDNNMQKGLQSYGINKRVITLTILDATHEQGINFYDAFKDSRFQNYVACVSL